MNRVCSLRFAGKISKEFRMNGHQRRFLLVFALMAPVVAWIPSALVGPCGGRSCHPSSGKPSHFSTRHHHPHTIYAVASLRPSAALCLSFSRQQPPKDPTGGRRIDSPGGSFVEGNEYDSSAAEIEAMGGDPFFLGDYSEDPWLSGSGGNAEADAGDTTWNGVEERWDGVVDDEAHFDFE